MENKIYEMYDNFDEQFWYIQIRRDLLDKSIKNLNSKKLTIADIGCGVGRHYNTLSKYGEVLCIDNNKNAVSACKKRGIKDVILADALNTKIKSESVDVACALDIIEHIENDLDFLNELYRILKPGGKLILTFPAFDFLWSVDDDMAHHKRRYTKKSFKILVNKTEFKINKLSYRYFFIAVPTIAMFFLQKIKKKKVNSLSMSPNFLNKFLIKIGNLENSLITKGITLPFGVSMFAILEKSKN